MNNKKTLNTGSFKFNFLVIYLYSAFIGVAMVVALSFYLKDIISTNNFYQSVAQPIVYQSQSSNTDINRHSSYLQSYLRSGNIDHKKEAERMLYNKLPKRIKAMVELSKKWDSDPQFLIRANDLMLQFEAINETYLLFENSGTSGDQLLNETYLPMLIKYGIDMKGFNDYQYNNYGQDLVNIFDQADKYKYLALFILLLLFGILGLFINNTSKKIKNGIDKLKEDIGTISLGNFPERIEKSDNELITIEDGLISLVGNLKNVEQFANEVGKGSFDSELSVFNNEGNLGRSLASMRSSLKQVSADGVIRDWNNTGLAKFGSIIQENTGDIGELIDLLIRELVKYTDSLQGGIFIVNNEDENDVHLELLGCYAYERKKFLERKVKPGQGYIGQTYLEGEPVYLRDIPQNYMSITSGLGKTNPTSLLIQPLISNDKIEGVLEIASLKEYPEHVQKFVSQVCENIASSISVAKTNTNMGKMIKDSTELTEQLQAQEEELRQNTEELQATQEDMERRIGELEKENNELKGELNNLQTT